MVWIVWKKRNKRIFQSKEEIRGFSKNNKLSFNIIWLSMVWIVWKKRNKRIFQSKEERLQVLGERVKLQSFWWLKSTYVTFDFDYQF